jgi:hypothetical protein
MPEIDPAAAEMGRISSETFELIRPHLRGKSSVLQGNIIAMLLGAWVAGHYLVPTKGQSEKKRVESERALRSRLMIATTHAAFAYARDQDQIRAEQEKKE